MSKSQAMVGLVCFKLERLARTDEDGLGLATNDPLLAEIMVANTLSNLAIAEAIHEQTEVIRRMPTKVEYVSHRYPDSQAREDRKTMLTMGENIVKILGDILQTLKDFLRLQRRK